MNLPQRATIKAFLFFYGLALLVQWGGSYFTFMSVTSWYTTLAKSPLTPPGIYFGIVWTTLYFLMALAATIVWKKTGTFNNRPLRWWYIQLLGGLVWCAVFFGMREIGHGLYVIGFEWVAVLLTLVFFLRVDRRAALLILPLMAWITFASYLNFYIARHNPPQVEQSMPEHCVK